MESKKLGGDKMSKEIAVAWKMRAKRGETEIEAVGMNPERTEQMFKYLEEKYLKFK